MEEKTALEFIRQLKRHSELLALNLKALIGCSAGCANYATVATRRYPPSYACDEHKEQVVQFEYIETYEADGPFTDELRQAPIARRVLALLKDED